MKNMILALMFGVVLFGLSAGVSLYLNPVTPVASNPLPSTAGESVHLEPTLPPDPAKIEQVPVMPVVNNDQSSITVEAVLQMSDAIKKMEGQLLEREKLVEKEEQRVGLMFKDLEREQDELEAFSKGISEKIQTLDQAMNSLRETLQTLDDRKQELAKLEKEAGVDEQSSDQKMEERVNDAKGWFKNLESRQAADYIREFANGGQLEFAAALVHKMEDRQKAKILTELNDPGLVQQLLDALNITKTRQ